MNGLLIAQGPGTSLFVANNANVQGNVAIVGNTSIGNNLFVTSNTTSQNTYTLGTTVTLGNTYTNTLQSNVFVNTALLTVTGPAYVAFLQANNFVNTALVTVTGNVYAKIIQANTSVNTALLTVSGNSYVTGTAYVNAIQANSSINTALLTVTGTSYTNLLQANNSVNTALITVTGNTYTNVLQANTSVNTSLITVTGNTYSGNLISNSALLVKGTTVLTGTANTLADLGVGGNLNVPNSLFMGNSTSSANIYSLTVGQSVGNGGLTVQGNFIIASPILYQAPSFTLYGSAPITGGNYANFSVYRTGANASIRWDETNKYFGVLNVTSNIYNQIVTGEQLSNLNTDTSTFNVATAYALSTTNAFLQSNDAVTLSTAKAYIGTVLSANVVNLQTQITSNVNSINSNSTTLNAFAASAYAHSNTTSNNFVGTSGSASPSNSSITLTSTNGFQIVGSNNTLTLNTPQDLRTSASPSFTNLSLTNPLAISQGGTGATSASGALTALLPTGTTTGYVLTTGGPGSFYWSASSGGGGGGGGATPGTTINSTRSSYVATGSQTQYSTGLYIPGASQLRVYIDGVRQFASEYTETSGNTSGSGIVTFSTPPATGSQVLFEIDGYIVNPYYANNIAYTVNSNINSSANTIQLAVDGLTSLVVNNYANTKAATTFSNAVTFTNTITSPTPLTNTNSTQVATTAFVQNLTNNNGSLATSITGNAGTVTNGVYNNGSYSDPTWITALSGSKISGYVANATNANNAINATNATKISNSGGWSIIPTGTKIYFNYNGTNVASLDNLGNLITLGSYTTGGTP